MASVQKRLPLQEDSAILLAHNLAFRLAGKAGLSVTEQVQFGGQVVQLSLLAQTRNDEILFDIAQRNGRILLRAASQKYQDYVEIEVPRLLDHADFESAPATGFDSESLQDQRFRDMQLFTLALSHELKNSIAKIKLAVSLVEQEDMQPEVNNYVKIIHRASDRLEQTMQNLNDIIKIRHSSESVRPIKPAKIFEDIREDFADILDGIDAKLEVNLDGGTEINYIETYLRSIFSNILSNATKYTFPGRPLQFKVDSRRQHPYVIFVFTDNGQGIDLEAIGDKLFEPPSRFSNNAPGSGLGLYLLKQMVERNGGKIEVRSEPGQGTSFHFFLKEY